MKERIEFVVYLVGAVIAGLFYVPTKEAVGSGMLLVALGVIYLLALRLLGLLLKRAVNYRKHDIRT